MTRTRIALIDDYQGTALTSAEWSRLDAEIVVFREPWRNEDHTAEALRDFDVVSLIRERTPFPASLIARLPRLKLISMTGQRTTTLDAKACTEHGIVVTWTTSPDSEATSELAIGLMLACARAIPDADAAMRRGGWQEGLPMGMPLEGARLGIVGLGKLGSKVAAVGKAFDMDVVAWSPNLTPERAEAGFARAVGKEELFATADVVSVHLVLSDRTRGLIGKEDLGRMKPGAILVNTARAPLIDQAALLEALREGRIRAGLDVYDIEPLPADHPYRTLPNVVLTPHLGYVVSDGFDHFFRSSLANIEAFLAGAPTNVFNPDVIGRERPR